jgi:hypothetical protein
VDPLAELIAASHAVWTSPVVASLLGTTDPAVVAEVLTTAVSDAVGRAVTGVRFYEPGVGIVVGLDLDGGRAVVAKLHRASFVSPERLAEVVRVQADLAAAGLPAPAPLAGPVAVGHGWLTVEELRSGAAADGYDAGVRREMATALGDFVRVARQHASGSRLGSWLRPPLIDDLWPEPHDLRFDFAGTSSGAEWIDDAARAARGVLAATSLPSVVGHLDWRVQNLGFDRGRVAAIYDWDSMGLVAESALVGVASVIHPVDWRRELPDPLPTTAQVDGFVDDYERARGAPFVDAEHEVLSAAQRWTVSYGTRCQHSDRVRGLFPGVDHTKGWPRLLRQLLDRQA